MSDQVKPVRYLICFFKPGSVSECVEFAANTPFHPVHAGDEVYGGTWGGYPVPNDKPIAKVTKVVHLVQVIAGTVYDSMNVFCEEINGNTSRG